MTAEPRCWGGGGGVSHPSQLTTGLIIKSVTTSPTLAGERMLFILQVSILSEQIGFSDVFCDYKTFFLLWRFFHKLRVIIPLRTILHGYRYLEEFSREQRLYKVDLTAKIN